jgi:GTP-binding protein
VPLLDCILDEIPAPEVIEGAPQMLITSLEYSSYVGRIAVGRIARGTFINNSNVVLIKRDGTISKTRIKELMVFDKLEKTKVDAVQCGDICAMVGIDGFDIGDTIADPDQPEALPTIAVDEPTMSMLFTINDSPFFGRDGKYVTSRHIKERLDKELEKNLALRVQQGQGADRFIVYGRGVLHLSVLIETMRREGYEFQVGQPKVLLKTIDDQKCEPIEVLTVDVPETLSSRVIDMITRRKGMLLGITTTGDRSRMEFDIPARGLIGLRSNMLTATQGEAIIAHRFKGYEPYKGAIEMRTNGSLIASESGTVYAYAIDKLQDKGKFFVSPQEDVYAGQVVGEHTRNEDLTINICKAKKLTNVRASGSDEKANIAPVTMLSLEETLEYIQDDEYVEITPKAIRMRKVLLNENDRKRKK